jgi:hypothetical protein
MKHFEWLIFNARRRYLFWLSNMQKNNLLYDEMILMAALYSANTLSGILIMENLRYSSENRYSSNSSALCLRYTTAR